MAGAVTTHGGAAYMPCLPGVSIESRSVSSSSQAETRMDASTYFRRTSLHYAVDWNSPELTGPDLRSCWTGTDRPKAGSWPID